MDDFSQATFEIGILRYAGRTKSGKYRYLVTISCVGARKYTTLYYEAEGVSDSNVQARKNALKKAGKIVKQLKSKGASNNNEL